MQGLLHIVSWNITLRNLANNKKSLPISKDRIGASILMRSVSPRCWALLIGSTPVKQKELSDYIFLAKSLILTIPIF